MKLFKPLLFILLSMLVLPLSAQDMPRGEAVKTPTPNPTPKKKTCAYCGIEKGNVTYAWQHYEWCPYYRAQESSAPSRPKAPTTNQIVTRAATDAITTAIGQSIANDVSRAMDEYAASASKVYTNTKPGESWGENGRYVVGVDELSWSKKCGVFDNKFRTWKVKVKYTDLRLVSMDAAIAVKGNKVGLLDCWTDTPVVPFDYDSWKFEPNGFFSALGRYTGTQSHPKQAEIKKHSKWGVWDDKGKNIVPVEYDSVKFSSIKYDGKFVLSIIVYKDGKLGLCDYDGDLVMPTEFNYISGVRKVRGDYCVFARTDRLYAVFDAAGKRLTDYKYPNLSWYEFFGVVCLDGGRGHCGMLDGKGQTVIPFQYDTLNCYDAPDSLRSKLGVSRLVLSQKDGRYGVFNVTGEELLEPRYAGQGEAYAALSRIPQYSYRYFLRQRAKDIINTKGEFETTAEFEARQKDAELQTRYVENELKGMDREFLHRQVSGGKMQLVLGDYNADEGYFDIRIKGFVENSYRLVIKRDDARQFKEAFGMMKEATLNGAKCFVANDAFAIAEMQFEMPDGRVYLYLNPNPSDNDGVMYTFNELK